MNSLESSKGVASMDEVGHAMARPRRMSCPLWAFLSLTSLLIGTIAWASVMTIKYNRSNKGNDTNTSSENLFRSYKSYSTSTEIDETNTKLAIIGGGVAGAYLAWRLATADDSQYKPTDIHLYERTDHISGRLYSENIGESLCDASEDFSPMAELGAMRLRDPVDKISLGALAQLGMKTIPFYMNAEDDSTSTPPTNPRWSRNSLGTVEDFFPPSDIPFVLGPQSFDLEQEQSHGNLYTPSYNPPDLKVPDENFDACDGVSNIQYLTQPYGEGGDPLYTYSVPEANAEFQGQTREDISYLNLVSGYDVHDRDTTISSPEFSNVPPLPEFKYIRPVEGMSAFPNNLANAAMGLGVTVSLNQEVTRVEQLGTSQWRVTLSETVTSTCTGVTKVKKDGSEKIILADKVVLALPKAALERIEFVGLDYISFKDKMYKLVNSVVPFHLMKLYAAWPERWWNVVNNLDEFSETNEPTLSNRNTTYDVGMFNNDLTTQVWAWYPGTQLRLEEVEENAPDCSKMGVLQQYVFANRINIFSSASEAEALNACPEDDACVACDPTLDVNDGWYSPGISKRLVDLVTRDLSTIFRKKVPVPSEIKYRIWRGDDPVTMADGVHIWKAGIEWWKVYNEALVPAANLHIIGETFSSSHQGWVEGALETTEHLVQGVFKMASPSWLSKDEYCASNVYFIPFSDSFIDNLIGGIADIIKSVIP